MWSIKEGLGSLPKVNNTRPTHGTEPPRNIQPEVQFGTVLIDKNCLSLMSCIGKLHRQTDDLEAPGLKLAQMALFRLFVSQ